MAFISNTLVQQVVNSQTDYQNIHFRVWTIGSDAEAIELRYFLGGYNDTRLENEAWQEIITTSGASPPYTYTLTDNTFTNNAYFNYQLRVRNTDSTYTTAGQRGIPYYIPPEAPDTLSVVNTTGGLIRLSWDDPLAGFIGSATGWQYSFDDTNWVNFPNTLIRTIGGLSENTSYTLYIRGIQGNTTPALLGASASIDVTTTTATNASNPVSFSVNTQQTTADLSWATPLDTGGVAITGYRVRWNQGNTPGGTWQNVGNVTSYQATGLDDGMPYMFQVQAVNSVGNGGITTRRTSTLGVPDAAVNLSADVYSVLVALTWEAPAHLGYPELDDYEIRWVEGNVAGGTWQKTGSTDTYYEVSGLEPATEYTFQVRGVNTTGEGEVASITATTLNIPWEQFWRLSAVPSLYIVYDTGDEVFVMPADTADGQTATATRRFDLPSGLTRPGGIAIDGNDLYITDHTGDEVFVVPADTADGQTATATRRFDLPTGLTAPFGIAIDGNDLYIADDSGDEVFVMPADTADGQTATATRRFDLPSGLTSPHSMTLDGNDLYIADNAGDEVFVMPADTADGQTATATRRFDLPSGLTHPYGITIGGNDLYVSNYTEVFVVPADTADGQTATATRRFDLPKVAHPWGMTISVLPADALDVIENIYKSILIETDRIYLTPDTDQPTIVLEAFDYTGNAITTDNLTHGIMTNGRLEAVTPFGKNRIISVFSDADEGVGGRILMIRDFAEEQGRFGAFEPRGRMEGERLLDIKSVTATRDGILIADGGDSALTNGETDAGLYLLAYDDVVNALHTDQSDTRPEYSRASFQDGERPDTITRNDLVASDGSRIYVAKDRDIYVYDEDRRIVDAEVIPLFAKLTDEVLRDMTTFNGYLYVLTTHRLMRIEIVRSRAPQPKQTIYPQFVDEGSALDLTQFVEGGNEIQWAEGFSVPSYLTIDNSYQLQVDMNAVTEDTTLLLKLLSINGIGETPFEFYLTVRQAQVPVWQDVDALSMFTDNTLNLLTLVDTADSIAWQSGFTPPSIFTLTDSELTITGNPTETTYRLSLTATKGSLTADRTFYVDVLRRSVDVPYSDTIRFRTEVAGIDITDDMNASPSVGKSLEPIRVNQATVNRCEIQLKNRNRYYSNNTTNNFWETHGLELDGYTTPVKLFVDSLVDGTWQPSLLFSGFVLKTRDSLNGKTLTLICVDDSYRLRDISATEIGITKQAHLYRMDDEDNFEGIYTPETALTPFLPQSARFAVSDQTALTLSDIRNPSVGPVNRDIIHVTTNDGRTQGGYRDDAPIVGIKTTYQEKKIAFWIQALANTAKLYNPQIDTPTPTLSQRFITNRGSLAFESDETRATRTPVDWVYDSTNAIVYVLISNPEAHVRDRLVAYHKDRDIFEVIHTFDTGVYVYRLATTDFDTFYFTAADAGAIDGSRVPKSRQHERFALNHDAAHADSTRIYRWVRSTGVLTDNFGNIRDIQDGVQYYAGFANKQHIQEYEGLVIENRNPFEFQNNNLYYRYASDTAFGVARVDTSGTPTTLFTETSDAYYNHLNFAFDVQSNGTVYFAYVQGGAYNEDTVLTIKSRTAAGVETTLLTDLQALHQLTVLDTAGGAYSGVHEVLYHNDKLYVVVQIQRVRYEDADDGTNTNRYRDYTKSAGAVLYELSLTGTPVLATLQTYDFTQFSARSLTVFDGEVYFVENPSYSYRFRPINPDLDSWNESLCYNLLPDNDGELKRITATDTVESLGNIWYGDSAYRGVPMPCLVTEDSLNIVANYAATDDLLRINADGSQPDNAQWITYGNRLDYVLPDPVASTQNVYAALADLALKTNSLFSVRENVIAFQDRDPFRASVNGAVTASATSITYDGANKAFPSSGYLLIDAEIIQYESRTDTQFQNLTRGVSTSPVVTHADDADILFLDTVIHRSSLNDPYRDITLQPDTTNFYNVIQDGSQTFDVRDAASVSEHGERIFTLNLGLTRNEKSWQEYIAGKYLENLKEVRYLININLTRSSPYIEIGDIVSFYYDGNLLYPMRVVSLNYSAEGIQLVGRTL